MASYTITVTLCYTQQEQEKSKTLFKKTLRKDDFMWYHNLYHGPKPDLHLSVSGVSVGYGSTGHLSVSFTDSDNPDHVKTQEFPFAVPPEDPAIKGKQKTFILHKGGSGVANTTLTVRFKKADVALQYGRVGLGTHLDWFAEFQASRKEAFFTYKLNEIKRKRQQLQQEMEKLDEEETALKKQKCVVSEK